MVKRTAPEWHWYRDEYLTSAHWEKMRADALDRAAHRCQLCGAAEAAGATLNVHHNNYERLYAERPSDVIVLCRGCHESFHAGGEIVRLRASVGFWEIKQRAWAEWHKAHPMSKIPGPTAPAIDLDTYWAEKRRREIQQASRIDEMRREHVLILLFDLWPRGLSFEELKAAIPSGVREYRWIDGTVRYYDANTGITAITAMFAHGKHPCDWQFIEKFRGIDERGRRMSGYRINADGREFVVNDLGYRGDPGARDDDAENATDNASETEHAS